MSQSPEQVQQLYAQFETEHDALTSAISSLEGVIGDIESEFDNIEFEGDDISSIEDIKNAFDETQGYLEKLIQDATETRDRIRKLL